MSKHEPGPREKGLREMRERRFAESRVSAKADGVGALREKVAAIPARKPPKQKKARR